MKNLLSDYDFATLVMEAQLALLECQLSDDEDGVESARAMIAVLCGEQSRRSAIKIAAQRATDIETLRLNPGYLADLFVHGRWISVSNAVKLIDAEMARTAVWLHEHQTLENTQMYNEAKAGLLTACSALSEMKVAA